MTAPNRRRILVLGVDTQSLLSIVRSLGRAGMEVHVAWCPLDCATLQSRYITAVHSISPYMEGDDSWLKDFQDLFRRETFDLVLPTTDATILPFQLFREHLEPFAKIYLLPDDVFRICSNKDETWELAHGLHVPVPRQQEVHSAQQAAEAAKQFGFPLVLKPRASATKDNPLQRQKVLKAENETELLPLATEMTARGPVFAQENFIGVGVGIDVLCSEGRVLMAFQHERVHEPLKGGGSSYRKSVALQPDMLAAAASIMGALRYTGVAMIELKQNQRTGQWVLIEINARFWGSLALCDAAGLDFPLALVRLLLDGEEPAAAAYRTGIYCRHWTADAQWFLSNLRADKSNATLQTRTLGSLIGELLPIITFRERSDTFTFDDPWPAWHDLKYFVQNKVFRLLRGFKPFRAFHRRRLEKLYRGSTRVIVLCYGNICRSPFASVFLEERTHKKVLSRGLHLNVCRPSPQNAILAAKERGIDLSRHGSALVTTAEINSTDLVLIFDRKHWLGIRQLAPDRMNRVAYLGAADPAHSLEIADPYGGDLERFRKCYARIEDALAKLSAE